VDQETLIDVCHRMDGVVIGDHPAGRL
jgi:hypothetical protein